MGMQLGLWRAGARRVRARGRAAPRRGGGGARPGVAPRPVEACPSGSAAAKTRAIYKGKPRN